MSIYEMKPTRKTESSSTVKIISSSDHCQFNNYRRLAIVVTYGEGCYVWDADGNRYLDMVSGIGVNLLGYGNRRLIDSAHAQMKTLIHASNLYYNEAQTRYAELLIESSCFDCLFFCNSGSEATEAAIKIARRAKAGRKEIICADRGFHGRTLGALSATGDNQARTGFSPLVDGFIHVPFDNIDALARAVSSNTCAILLEPVLGHAGIIVPQTDYIKQVSDLCHSEDLLLIFDECLTGLGRTGRMFAYEYFGVVPDMITVGKALGGGFPLAAVLSKEHLKRTLGVGDHGSTFGGNPVACAAGAEVLSQVIEQDLASQAADVGRYLLSKLIMLKEKYPSITTIRGLGLMIGIELKHNCREIVRCCAKQGLLVDSVNDFTIRLLPPLTFSRMHADEFVEIFDRALSTMTRDRADSCQFWKVGD